MIQLKSFGSKIDDVKDKGIVTIAISKFDIEDSAGDIVRKGAFADTFINDMSRIKHLIDHDFSIKNLIGYPIKLWETNEYAMVQSQLLIEKELARDVFVSYKAFAEAGRTLEHSYAYRVTGKQPNDKIGGVDITALKMREYSTVLFGCNEHTPMIEAKSEKDISDYIERLELILKKADISELIGLEIEKKLSEIKSILGSTDKDELNNQLFSIIKKTMK